MRAMDKRGRTSDQCLSAEELKARGSDSRFYPLPFSPPHPRPEALQPHHSLRRSDLGTSTNEVREFCFHRAYRFQPSTTQPSQDYNTQRAPPRRGAEPEFQVLGESEDS